MARPIRVGTGECACGRVDVALYHAPGAAPLDPAVCAVCLGARGFEVVEAPEPPADSVVEWKRRLGDDDSTPPYPSPLVHVGQMNLGHGHLFEAVLDQENQLIGWLHTHPDARDLGVLCQSFCAVRALGDTPIHQVVSADPLTLTPSLKCRTCGAHGDVTNGRWEPR